MLFICCCDAVISVSDTIAVTVMLLLELPPAFTWLPVLALPNRLGPDTGATAVVDVPPPPPPPPVLDGGVTLPPPNADNPLAVAATTDAILVAILIYNIADVLNPSTPFVATSLADPTLVLFIISAIDKAALAMSAAFCIFLFFSPNPPSKSTRPLAASISEAIIDFFAWRAASSIAFCLSASVFFNAVVSSAYFY
jgi:hypothetical protein